MAAALIVDEQAVANPQREPAQEAVNATFPEHILRFTLREEDRERLQWLAKDLGFRELEVYTANAIRLYATAYGQQRAGKRLFYGSNPLTAVRFDLPMNREAPVVHARRDAGAELSIRLSQRQAETLKRVCGIEPLGQIVWNALWAYYDLMSDYAVGKRIFVEDEDESMVEVEMKPQARPRR